MAESPHAEWWARWNPVEVTAGPGSIEALANLTPPDGNALLVTTEGFTRRGMTSRLRGILSHLRVSVYDGVTPNPQLDAIDDATERFADTPFDVIVAVGGGSAIDSAKVLGVTLPMKEHRPLARVLRSGQPQQWNAGIPVVAVPTTSGTGAEATSFATVWDGATHRKHSVLGRRVYPVRAVLDPELTLTLPFEETLHSGLDAISHALESLWNRNRTAVSTAWSLQALALAASSFPEVLRAPAKMAARADMQQASFLAGLAISQTRTAIAHSISYPLTLRFGVPHGLACSFTLPALLELNADRLASLAGGRFLFDEIVTFLTGLELAQRVGRFATLDQILAVEGEMQTAERMGNYAGAPVEPGRLVEAALAA